MKKLALAIASIVATGSAFAAESYTDNARVLSVTPVHERIPVTREECWNENQRIYEDRTITRSDTGVAIGPGTVLGAVIGGVVGHQFGNSSGGRDRGTAAGAIVGGLVGNQVDKQNAAPATTEVERVPVDRTVQRCRTVQEVRDATLGFDVRYRFAGRDFMTRLDRDPGPNLRVAVNVAPIEGREVGSGPRHGPRPGDPAYR